MVFEIKKGSKANAPPRICAIDDDAQRYTRCYIHSAHYNLHLYRDIAYMAKKGKEYVCCCTSLDDDVSTHTHTQYIIIRSHHNILHRRRCDTCATSTSGRTTQPRTSAQSQASRESRCKSFLCFFASYNTQYSQKFTLQCLSQEEVRRQPATRSESGCSRRTADLGAKSSRAN